MKKAERKKQILDCAMTLFAKYGYKGTTTAAIAKKSEISEVTLFRNFSSKQEIFMKCIEPVFVNTLEETLDFPTETDPKGSLKSILQERIKTISKNYELVKLILSESEFISDFREESLMQIMSKRFMAVFEKIGIPKAKREFVLRLVMGSILSYLYLPQADEEKIQQYSADLAEMIITHAVKEVQNA
ncbi:TetR/AcrR family transcriptional regulator [Alkalibacter mobilis]|uniref:TetR/AcrR family transcriptional regulator n=1 Tax=Alkalibacter mobilis TaxID=2787712 RepID=UPI0018A06D2B|nr:TetR/AcrR family transcriptional regulator [Alkalibacter mobilis]MBF7095586.1 TetR/AcrR family transcriptional regulator [Alkalibacter mobilis]